MYDSEDLAKMKTLWPRYLLFKDKIQAINLVQVDFKKFENVIGEPTTPPVLEKLDNHRYICRDGNCRLSVAVKDNYTHALCYIATNKHELIFFKRLNNLVYENEKNKILMNDFEFIFKDEILAPLAYDKCKHLF